MIIYYNEKLDAKIRVFISSTFRDMQNERNVIVGSVFPLLRRRYKNQCVDITEVDLRWGITEKDIEKLALLEICIAETLNCVPFFIGLVGENYGTLARLDEIKRLPPSYKRAIGMRSREDFPEGVSLTELEMRAGVFTKKNREYARFFIRRSCANPPAELERLKNFIVNEDYEYSLYENSSELETLVYDSLERLIENVLPGELPEPFSDKHYISHLRFLKKENLSYIPNDAFIERAENVINSSRCVYLYGEKGSGKTATMSYLIAREGLDRDTDVFFHFADADEESLNQDNVYKRLRAYLESITEMHSYDMSDYNAVLEILKSKSFDKKILLYFDAVEKYNDTTMLSKLFTFNKINPNVFVVCSGVKSYKNIPAEHIEILPLDNEQIRQMIVRSLRNYGKKLDDSHMARIFENPCCRNPLYLNALLNQLIAYGNHESFEAFFAKLTSCSSLGEIFNVTISRLEAHFEEKGFDSGKIYKALALMAYSNMGIRESELGEIIGMLPIERSIFLASIEIFITENDSLIRFNHDLIAIAVKELLDCIDEGLEQYAREALIEYFETDDNRLSLRAFSEAPYQYYSLELSDKLFEIISDVDCFTYLSKNQYNNLIRYLVCINDKTEKLISILIPAIKRDNAAIAADVLCQAGHYTAAIRAVCHAVGVDGEFSLCTENAADEIADKIISSPANEEDKVRFFATLARSYYKLALLRYSAAERAYVRAIEYYKQTFPNDSVGLATQSYLLGVTYKSMGNMESAERLLKLAAEIFDANDIKNDISSWIYSVYGNIRFVLGDIKTARDFLRRAINDNAFLFGEDSSEIAWSYSYAWAMYYANGEKSTSFKLAQDAFRIYSDLYRNKGTKTAWAATNYGSAYHIKGCLADAEKYYKLSIRENNAAASGGDLPHVYSLTTYANLAVLKYEEGDSDEAVRLIELARENSEKKNGEKHLYTANMLLNEGIIKCSAEIIKKAKDLYEQYETPDRFFAKNCYVRVLLLTGEEEMAENEIDKLYQEYSKSALQLDLITYLINESYEKISFSADEAVTRQVKEQLTRFSEYKHYLTLNNSSALVLIPEI